jgi:hypothetical protein
VPENVFVDDRHRVRVADFGMSLLSGVTPVDGDPRADPRKPDVRRHVARCTTS